MLEMRLRRYLEWVLENICKSTGVQITFKDQGYTVGNDRSCKRKVERIIEDEEIKSEIRIAFKEIDKSIMGNLLSHNNELSANASIKM